MEIQVGGNGFQLDGGPQTYAALVDATEGYSGREIERVCKEAVAAMVAEQNRDIPTLIDQGLDKVRGHKLQVRALTQRDFATALERTTPATSPAEMARYREWREQTEA